MLDMTTPGKVGMFIGAWGSASAFARLLGSLSTAVIRDLARLLPNQAVLGYVAGFVLLALFLVGSLVILEMVDMAAFRKGASDLTTVPAISVVERAVLTNE